MPDLGHGYDTNTVEDAPGKDPAPAGRYLLVAKSSEIKKNKPKKDEVTGAMVETGWHVLYNIDIAAGAHKGKRIFQRFNLGNVSEQARDWAQAEHNAMIKAMGWPGGQFKDTDWCNGKPFIGVLSVEAASDDGKFPAKNNIDAYEPGTEPPPEQGQVFANQPAGAPPPMPGAQPPAQQQAAPSGPPPMPGNAQAGPTTAPPPPAGTASTEGKRPNWAS